MLTLQSIFASGWLQIIILLVLFMTFTNWALSRGMRNGYALGWLIGVFMIVAIGALSPESAIQLSAPESPELGLGSVVLSSCLGSVIAMAIVGMTVALRQGWFRQVFAVAGITAVLLVMQFMMMISPPAMKMSLTLMSLAFAIVMGTAYVVRRAYMQQAATTVSDDLSAQSAIIGGNTERIREKYAPNTF